MQIIVVLTHKKVNNIDFLMGDVIYVVDKILKNRLSTEFFLNSEKLPTGYNQIRRNNGNSTSILVFST